MPGQGSLQTQALRQVPHGQLVETLKSLQKISPIEIDSTQFKQQLKQYSEKHLTLYKALGQNGQQQSNNGKQKYICFLKQQRHNDSDYKDNLRGIIYKVDEITEMIISETNDDEIKVSEKHRETIEKLYKCLGEYLKKYYGEPYGFACHCQINGDSFEKIIIGLTSKHVSFGNMTTGEWSSIWTFSEKEFSANINIGSHYFQTGNILFNRVKTISKEYQKQMKLSLSNLNEKGLNLLIQIIQNQESAYQKQMEIFFAKKLQNSLKKLRKISPITQSKMIWNINTVLLSRGIKQVEISDD